MLSTDKNLWFKMSKLANERINLYTAFNFEQGYYF